MFSPFSFQVFIILYACHFACWIKKWNVFQVCATFIGSQCTLRSLITFMGMVLMTFSWFPTIFPQMGWELLMLRRFQSIFFHQKKKKNDREQVSSNSKMKADNSKVWMFYAYQTASWRILGYVVKYKGHFPLVLQV